MRRASKQMFDWMYQSREEFLLNYFDIGNSHTSSKELQEDHKHFSLSSMVTFFFFPKSLSDVTECLIGHSTGHVRYGQSITVASRPSFGQSPLRFVVHPSSGSHVRERLERVRFLVRFANPSFGAKRHFSPESRTGDFSAVYQFCCPVSLTFIDSSRRST